jgi:hypothetical protein
MFDRLPFDPYAPAAVAGDGSFALVYLPENRSISVDLAVLSGEHAKARWLNPRNGASHSIGVYLTVGVQSFTPPHTDPDWVLIIERVQ